MKKAIIKLLSFIIIVSFVCPPISQASNNSEYVVKIIYQDQNKIVTANIPNNLSENKYYLDKIKTQYLESLNKTVNFNNFDRNYIEMPLFVTPENPPRATKKLISLKRWGYNDVIRKLSETKKGNAAMRKAINSNVPQAVAAIIDLLGGKGVASLARALFGVYSEYLSYVSEKWLAESAVLILKGRIRYVEQRIYQNLAGDYPKVFVEHRRVK